MTLRATTALALLLAASAPASADIDRDLDPGLVSDAPADYDVANAGWNGLSTFAQLAQGDGFEVHAVTSIDWDDLTGDDVLVLLYPTNEVDASHVNQFIRNGGKVILGDDFGAGAKVFSRLGAARDQGTGVGAARYYDDLPFAPIATPLADHPLAEGVEELVTNYPSIIIDAGGHLPIFGFGEGEAVVVAGSFGAGRFVILSDPSMLVNNMLQFPGNFQFALNVLRHFAGKNIRGRVVILAGGFSLTGEPTEEFDDGTLKGNMAGALRDFNNWLDEVNDWFLDPGAMRVIAVIAGLLLAVLAGTALPLKKGTVLDGSWLRARGRDPRIGPTLGRDYNAILERFDRDRFRGSYLLPAAILRDSVDARLGHLLEREAPLTTLQASELFAQIEVRSGLEARKELTRLHALVHRMPGRAQAQAEWEGRMVSRREFDQMHDTALRLYAALDAHARAGYREHRPGMD